MNATTKKLLRAAELEVLEKIATAKRQHAAALHVGKTPAEAIATAIFNLGLDVTRAALDLPAPTTRTPSKIRPADENWELFLKQAAEMLAGAAL